VKDVGTDIINALTAVARVAGNKKYLDRITEYRRYCAINDVALAGAVTDVKGDRSKGPSQQSSPDYYLRVVDETEDEIVVSGAKAHITASAYADEIIVIPPCAYPKSAFSCFASGQQLKASRMRSRHSTVSRP
jgi:aromatic ring hydroxylase